MDGIGKITAAENEKREAILWRESMDLESEKVVIKNMWLPIYVVIKKAE